MLMRDRRRALMMFTSRVPAGFRELDYIESDGNAYILTSIAPGSREVRFRGKWYKSTQASAEQALFALAYGTTENAVELGFSATANRVFLYSKASSSSGNSAMITNAAVYNNWVDFIATVTDGSPKKSFEVTAGGNTLSATATTDNSPNLETSTLALFTGRVRDQNCPGKMGELIMEIGSGFSTVAAHLIPVERLSDNIKGYYETISGAFYPSDGSSDFSGG